MACFALLFSCWKIQKWVATRLILFTSAQNVTFRHSCGICDTQPNGFAFSPAGIKRKKNESITDLWRQEAVSCRNCTTKYSSLEGEQVPTGGRSTNKQPSTMTLSRLLRPSLLNTAGRSSRIILLRQPLYQYQPALFRSTRIGKNAAPASGALSPAMEHQQWIEQGIMDEDGLVNFDTLHNMQTRACTAYSQRNLFATYSTEAKQFQWMTYAECKLLTRRKENAATNLGMTCDDALQQCRMHFPFSHVAMNFLAQSQMLRKSTSAGRCYTI
jgi:hypothetical protein